MILKKFIGNRNEKNKKTKKKKKKEKMDKPVYLGLLILNIVQIAMYEFCYYY